MADLVAVMKDGRIEQYGAPADVRRNPRTAFVSEFLRLSAANSRRDPCDIRDGFATASATLMPSTAAERMPPAKPAPSPAG